ncbi:hypothetical protein ACFL0T_08455 [Candidatus Omnitrophota bacterium]
MKVLAWYSGMTVSLTSLLGVYGFFITKETHFIGMIALLTLYLPPAIYIWLTLFKKK